MVNQDGKHYCWCCDKMVEREEHEQEWGLDEIENMEY
jgi:hypothetical protein